MTYRPPAELNCVRARCGVLPANEEHAVQMEKEFQAGMRRLVCPDCGLWVEIHVDNYAKVNADGNGMRCPNISSHDGFGCRTTMIMHWTP